MATALVAVVGAGGLAVVSAAGAASAAPYHESPAPMQVGYTDSANGQTPYDWAGDTNAPLGTWQDGASQLHTSRVYATFDLTGFASRRIIGGKVSFREQSAAECPKRAIEVWRSATVTQTPTWAGAPAGIEKLDEAGDSTYCPAELSFDIAKATLDDAREDDGRITIELRVSAQHESDVSYGRRLNWYKRLQLSVTYNSLPTVDEDHLYNGGFPCREQAPYPALPAQRATLQAVGDDPDDWDSLRLDVGVWPVGDPATRTERSQEHGQPGRATTVQVPDTALVDGTTYAWQARVSDGMDTSAWSRTCYFTVDRTAPPAAQVTSANYPRSNVGSTPVGEPGVFTLSGGGNADVVGFAYAWESIPVPGCGYGDVGQLVCPDPVTAPGTVQTDVPGGSATLTLNPPRDFLNTLVVRSLDRAGNRSAETRYEIQVPDTDPVVTVVGGQPGWGDEATVRITPHAGIAPVTEYEYLLTGGPKQTVQAGPDGSATVTFTADEPTGYQLTVRSRSTNGWVSSEGRWSLHFNHQPPGVSSTVYPDNWEPSGGVGVPGTFVFSPPSNWDEVTEYRYRFSGDSELQTVAAGPDGTATITWTPAASGFESVEVYAVRPDGKQSYYSNSYYFMVA
ncbi:hypothetical protein ACH4T9_19460 [Micromonospora sp. NPDC020750]|uniref:hypothetical protein n=1 Tax=unclassified Micromonospora TaxID=2617518 RepID=UPI0037AA4903